VDERLPGGYRELTVRANTGLIFWGVALVTAGVVALAVQAGNIDESTIREAWRFWPVIIIVIGLAVIASRTPFAVIATIVAALVVGGLGGTLVAGVPEGFSFGCEAEAAGETVSEKGSFGTDPEVDLDLNCGELTVRTAAGSDWSFEARHAGEPPRIEADDEGLRVESPDTLAFFGFGEAEQSWNLTLPTETKMGLSVDANAASSRLELGGASLSRLELDANAGDVDIALTGAMVDELTVDANAGSISIEVDDATRLTGSVEMNAGSLELCAPDGVGVAITVSDDNPSFSHNLDELGLSRDGEVWRGGSGEAVTLSVEGNAASLTINPDGGCT
jgi:cell wall-active antibiotic response 4TMS protein YvqF